MLLIASNCSISKGISAVLCRLRCSAGCTETVFEDNPLSDVCKQMLPEALC
jgi:hypothetical protein